MKLLLLPVVVLSACTGQFVTKTDSTTAPTTIEATPTVEVTNDTARQLAIGDICAAVALSRSGPDLRSKIAELRQQSDFTSPELSAISKGEVFVGMSEQAGICALGGNSITIKSVKTTTTAGHFVQEMTFNGVPTVILTTDNYIVSGLRS